MQQTQEHRPMTPTAPPAGVDISRLFAAHAPFLVRTAHRLTGSRAVAEDVVQEAFLIAHQKRDTLVDQGDIRGWLYRVMVHRIAHWRRGSTRRDVREERAAVPLVDGETPERAVANKEQTEHIHAAIADLPLHLREVFVLFELEGQSGADIALLLGIPMGTVWTRLAAARPRFQKAYARREKREIA